jgi:hypothetical protein
LEEPAASIFRVGDISILKLEAVVPPECYRSTKLPGATYQENVTFTLIAVRTTNLLSVGRAERSIAGCEIRQACKYCDNMSECFQTPAGAVSINVDHGFGCPQSF